MANLIVISGLPASGKTSLGKEIAKVLGYSFLDKDKYLEKLYGLYKRYDRELRQKLSRQSDHQFQKDSEKSGDSVLCSFWRPRNMDVNYGTPTGWIDSICTNPIEIYCKCDVETAVSRFLNRTRHPGHMDELRPKEELESQFQELSLRGSIGVGKCLSVDTSKAVDAHQLCEEISLHFSR